MTSDARICFVIMPFSKTQSATEEEWTRIFEEVFSACCRSVRLLLPSINGNSGKPARGHHGGSRHRVGGAR